MELPYQLIMRQYPAHESIPYIVNSEKTTITTHHFKTFDEAFFQLYFASSQRIDRETAIQNNRLYFIENASIKGNDDTILLKLTAGFLDGDMTFASDDLKATFAQQRYYKQRHVIPIENTVGLEQRADEYKDALFLYSGKLRHLQQFDYIKQRLITDEETLQTFPNGFVESTIKRLPDLKSAIATLINENINQEGKIRPVNYGEKHLFSSIDYTVTERPVAKLIQVKNPGEVFDVGIYLQFTDKTTAQTFITRDTALSKYITNLNGLFPIADNNLKNTNEIVATPQTTAFLHNASRNKAQKLLGSFKLKGVKKRGLSN